MWRLEFISICGKTIPSAVLPHLASSQRNHPGRPPPDAAAVSTQRRSTAGHVRRTATAAGCLRGMAASTNPGCAGTDGYARDTSPCAGFDGGRMCRGVRASDGDWVAALAGAVSAEVRGRSSGRRWRTRSRSSAPGHAPCNARTARPAARGMDGCRDGRRPPDQWSHRVKRRSPWCGKACRARRQRAADALGHPSGLAFRRRLRHTPARWRCRGLVSGRR